MVEQVVQVQRVLDTGRVRNVVFMGMGEPLANYEPVVRAVRLPCMVNLIPQNPLAEGGRPDDKPALRFARLLRARGVAVAVRRSRGAEVLGACGQLHGRAAESPREG